MRRLKRSLIFALLALWWSPMALGADVSIEPPLSFIQPSETATVTVEVGGVVAPGLAGFQVVVTFDPTVLAAADPNASLPEEPFEPSPWLLTSTGRVPVGVTVIDNVGPAWPPRSSMQRSVQLERTHASPRSSPTS